MKKRITTIASVDAVKPIGGRQVEYPDAKVAGLALRVSPKAKKTWTLRYRTHGGDQRRISLGVFPVVSLADARGKALRVLGSAAEGGDPARDKRAAKALARAKKLFTVSDLIESYFADAARGRHRPNGRPKRKSTLDLERSYFERLVKPRFGLMPITEVSRGDVQRFLDEIGETSRSAARHCRDVIRQAFNYAIRREAAEKNPAQFAELSRSHSRERVLTDAELRAIWRAASDPARNSKLAMSPGMGLAICLAMVTLQRGGEVSGLNRRELDHQTRTWTIPGERTKNHRTHVVPLSAMALDLIDRSFALAGEQKGFAFPSPRGKGPITRRALTRAMKRITTLLKVPDATPHDFRRTGSTNITSERIGLPRFIVSRVLNQISDTGGAAAATGVYDRNEYLPEKRRALDAWAALLAEIVADKKRPSNVVPLAGAA